MENAQAGGAGNRLCAVRRMTVAAERDRHEQQRYQ
jgi:hypothetical protein